MKINNPWVLVPENVLKDPDLTFREKIMFSKILALDNGEEHCYANNHYFSELMSVGKTTVSRIINSLKFKGYIEIENSQSKHRRIKICSNQPSTNGQSNFEHMYKHNNNNKNNNKKTLTKDIFDRILEFQDSMRLSFEKNNMPDEEQKKFLDYWCEVNDTGTKFRVEKQEFFNKDRRIKTCISRAK